jgi:hypothetical protein
VLELRFTDDEYAQLSAMARSELPGGTVEQMLIDIARDTLSLFSGDPRRKRPI